MSTRDLLIEIGTEELPPVALEKLSVAFTQQIKKGLEQNDLTYGLVHAYATPRRLAVHIEDLLTKQADKTVERVGPTVASAFDADNNPTPACQGFAKSCSTTVDKLSRTGSDKGEKLYFKQEVSGQTTNDIIPGVLEKALSALPIPKPMRWGNYSAAFARPIHWLIILFGNDVIDANLFHLKSGNKTFGHRFHAPKAITIKKIKQYVSALHDKGYVVASHSERKAMIKNQLHEAANPYGSAVIDTELLHEVTGLVEWPVVLVGELDERFLALPPETLISVLKKHQKCFPIKNKAGELQPYFMTVANIESKNPQKVIAGNKRVVRARLCDAEFFYKTDGKQTLEKHAKQLATVVFQKQLGTVDEKTKRVSELAQIIANIIGADVALAKRAGELSKADLVTQMVFEFPELQGIMGYYYAINDGEDNAVALALKEQYLPKFAGDVVAGSAIGSAIAIADRIDTIVGIFAINQQPTGEKDPFGLRRSALGLLRTIIENKLSLDIKVLIHEAAERHSINVTPQVKADAFQFIMERLRTWYLDQDITADVFAAVQAIDTSKPLDFDHRIHAVCHFKQLSEAADLAAANKRVNNILKKQGTPTQHTVNPELFELDAEKLLAQALEAKAKEVEILHKKANYQQELITLASLKQPINQFFDDVMVMTDDENRRNNRLALLVTLRNLFLSVADVSLLSSSS